MRRLVIGVFLYAVCAANAWGDNIVGEAAVRLYTPADLANLRATNFAHYARAQHIIAAANRLCAPTPPRLEEAALNARRVACGHALLTSNPPKRELAFTLDHTSYVALVTITDTPPRAIEAQ